MNNIKLLDCTLRDGGRIINCGFEDAVIAGIVHNLTNSNIDIIEIGFLRAKELVEYKNNSTFFTEVEQMIPFIPLNKRKAIYTAFIDFDMYDFSILEKSDGDSITGIRVGFTKKQFEDQREELKKCLLTVKRQGYKLFMQGVNTLAYHDREMLELIEFVNEIEPYSFGIVDTYGGMYLDDFIHYFNLVDYNLNNKINIDIHSHNNFQLSFAFAQQAVASLNDKRTIIVDCTLNGMGKCAGNLNTELIADFLVRKRGADYDVDRVLDIIDRYLYPIKERVEWGYSVPAFMAGLYKSHPNNVIYLTEKYRLNSKDIKHIISAIDADTRQRYDYDNIQKIYKNYCACKVDDSLTLDCLAAIFSGKEVLVVAPGSSVRTYFQRIAEYIRDNAPIVVCVNFEPLNFKADYLFYANTIHWEKVCTRINHEKCILTSNIHEDIEGTYLLDYASLIEEDSILYDNSTIMLLNLLKKLQVKGIVLAGFDGLKKDEPNYVDNSFLDRSEEIDVVQINKEISEMITQYQRNTAKEINISFLTPSIYEQEAR